VSEQKKQDTEEKKRKRRRRRGKGRKGGSSGGGDNAHVPGQQSQDQNFNQKLRELVKKYKGFDPWEKEHKAQSSIERQICKYLDENGMDHKHRGKKFNVVLPDKKAVVFEPDIIIPHPRINEKPILIQAVHPKNQQEIVPVLNEFKKQLGTKYYIVAVTNKDNLTNVSPTICDLLLAVEYASSLPSQLRSHKG
jgi:hypothetical protein